MVDVEFRCEKCAKRYRTDESHSGEITSCTNCGCQMEVPYPPLELPDELTSGGSTVYRHEVRSRDFEAADGDLGNIEQIDRHIERHLGTVDVVMHELVSDLVHIDIHWVQPTEERPFHTLVTSGMSDRAMSTPDGMEELAYAELMICLPADWPLDDESMKSSEYYWPIYWLKYLARFPHEYETWLFEGHTIPNGDPAEALDAGNDFIGWLLAFPVTAPESFVQLEVSPEKTIHFLSILPLYPREMEYKLKKGTERLLSRFDKAEISEIVEIGRRDVTEKRFRLF